MKRLTWQEVVAMDEEWVSVKDALPPCGMEVLVYMPDKDEPTPGYTYHRVTALARKIPFEGSAEYYWDNRYPGIENYHLSMCISHWRRLPVGP